MRRALRGCLCGCIACRCLCRPCTAFRGRGKRPVRLECACHPGSRSHLRFRLRLFLRLRGLKSGQPEELSRPSLLRREMTLAGAEVVSSLHVARVVSPCDPAVRVPRLLAPQAARVALLPRERGPRTEEIDIACLRARPVMSEREAVELSFAERRREGGHRSSLGCERRHSIFSSVAQSGDSVRREPAWHLFGQAVRDTPKPRHPLA